MGKRKEKSEENSSLKAEGKKKKKKDCSHITTYIKRYNAQGKGDFEGLSSGATKAIEDMCFDLAIQIIKLADELRIKNGTLTLTVDDVLSAARLKTPPEIGIEMERYAKKRLHEKATEDDEVESIVN